MNENYQALLAKADAHFQSVRHTHPEQFACRSGCADCCRQHLSLTPLEAAALDSVLAAHPQRTLLQSQARQVLQHPEQHPDCPLLVEKKCSIYNHRPLICRTHGTPIVYETEEGYEADVCPLNFQALPLSDLPSSSFLNLETLNLILAAVNIQYCRQMGLEPERRVPLAELVARQSS